MVLKCVRRWRRRTLDSKCRSQVLRSLQKERRTVASVKPISSIQSHAMRAPVATQQGHSFDAEHMEPRSFQPQTATIDMHQLDRWEHMFSASARPEPRRPDYLQTMKLNGSLAASSRASLASILVQHASEVTARPIPPFNVSEMHAESQISESHRSNQRLSSISDIKRLLHAHQQLVARRDQLLQLPMTDEAQAELSALDRLISDGRIQVSQAKVEIERMLALR